MANTRSSHRWGAVLLLGALVACGKKSDGDAQGSATKAAESGAASAAGAGSAAKSTALPPPKLETWAKNFGSNAPDGDAGNDYIDPEVGDAVAIDAEGNVIVGARVREAADFGGGALAAAGALDIVVAKYDKSGAHQWSKRFGGTDNERIEDLAVDGAGNVYVCGAFYGGVDFGKGPLKAKYAGFLLKLDKAGTVVWSQAVGTPFVNAVAATPEGELVVGGNFSDSLTLGSEERKSPEKNNLFFARLGAGGTVKWLKTFPSKSSLELASLGVHTDGSVYVLASFRKTVDFGGGPLTSAGLADVAVAKFDSNGGHVWSKGFGSATAEDPERLGLDAAGSVVITGDFSKPVDFGGGPLTSSGGEELFLAKLDTNGAHVWSKHIGGRDQENARGLAVNGRGDIAITGEFKAETDVSGKKLLSAGEHDAFIARFDASGAVAWAKRFGGPASEWARDVAIDEAGGVATLGGFRKKATHDAGALTSNGSSDIYLLTFSP